MNKTILITFIVIFASLPCKVFGSIPILYSNGEEITKVKELPSSDEYTIEGSDGHLYHADLAVKHEQFCIFYVPLWNYGTYKYVLYSDTKVGSHDGLYAELAPDDIQYLQAHFSGIPTEPDLPFWDKYGGKILAVVVCLIQYGIFSSDDKQTTKQEIREQQSS